MYKYQSVCSKIHVVACLWAGLKVESWEHLRPCPVGASEPMSVCLGSSVYFYFPSISDICWDPL